MAQIIYREGQPFHYPGREQSIDQRKLRLYHYTSFNSFVRIWLTQELKFGVVTDMNDMFENNPSVQCHTLNEVNLLDKYLKEKKRYKQISLTMDYDSYIQGCMSQMMWGVYGDKGKGVCLEINYTKLMEHINKHMLHDSITYTDKLPEPPTITKESANNWNSFFRQNQKDIFFTKLDCWSKENEYRIVSKKDDYLRIDGAITAIYIADPKSKECECIEQLLQDNKDVYFKCVYMDSMLNVGTYINLCDVEYRKRQYSHDVRRRDG